MIRVVCLARHLGQNKRFGRFRMIGLRLRRDLFGRVPMCRMIFGLSIVSGVVLSGDRHGRQGCGAEEKDAECHVSSPEEGNGLTVTVCIIPACM